MIEIKPASTVLLVREKATPGIEVLLLKRNSSLKFAPNYWVFPGGRIDETDGPITSDIIEHTAKTAAARESMEECKMQIDPEFLRHYCHWTTPAGGPVRFGTWFFHGRVDFGETNVIVDQSEIVDHQWLSPIEAIHMQKIGELDMLPPTFISLQRIKKASSYSDVIKEFDRTGVVKAEPVVSMRNGTFYSLYKGDAGYQKADPSIIESKHRLIIDQKTNRYTFEYENCPTYPPVNGGVQFD